MSECADGCAGIARSRDSLRRGVFAGGPQSKFGFIRGFRESFVATSRTTPNARAAVAGLKIWETILDRDGHTVCLAYRRRAV